MRKVQHTCIPLEATLFLSFETNQRNPSALFCAFVLRKKYLEKLILFVVTSATSSIKSGSWFEMLMLKRRNFIVERFYCSLESGWNILLWLWTLAMESVRRCQVSLFWIDFFFYINWTHFEAWKLWKSSSFGHGTVLVLPTILEIDCQSYNFSFAM